MKLIKRANVVGTTALQSVASFDVSRYNRVLLNVNAVTDALSACTLKVRLTPTSDLIADAAIATDYTAPPAALIVERADKSPVTLAAAAIAGIDLDVSGVSVLEVWTTQAVTGTSGAQIWVKEFAQGTPLSS